MRRHRRPGAAPAADRAGPGGENGAHRAAIRVGSPLGREIGRAPAPRAPSSAIGVWVDEHDAPAAGAMRRDRRHEIADRRRCRGRCRRLVEQPERRRARDQPRQRQPPPLPGREQPARPVGERAEPEARERRPAIIAARRACRPRKRGSRARSAPASPRRDGR